MSVGILYISLASNRLKATKLLIHRNITCMVRKLLSKHNIP
jgi:hypothetical protein